MNKRHNAFTLVEILVVLAIIAILAAILFPAFNRAKESARQTNCAANLAQIHFAVKQYRADNNRYPESLVALLGEGAKYDANGTTGTLGSNAPAYYKGNADTLVCQDDDSQATVARSSYGFLSEIGPTAPALPVGQITSAYTGDLSQYVWNYWGTRDDGFTFGNPSIAKTAVDAITVNPGAKRILLTNPLQAYNQQYATGFNNTLAENVVKYSLSNRNAPEATIITHCIYHRLQTGNNVNAAGELYGPTPIDSTNTKDIILRLDGTAKAVDVTQWKTGDVTTNPWQTQTQ